MNGKHGPFIFCGKYHPPKQVPHVVLALYVNYKHNPWRKIAPAGSYYPRNNSGRYSRSRLHVVVFLLLILQKLEVLLAREAKLALYLPCRHRAIHPWKRSTADANNLHSV